MMLTNYRCVLLCSLFLLLVSSAQGQRFDHHPPYQDPHFAPDQTPRYDYGTQTSFGNYYPNRGTCGSAACATCNGGGNGADSDAIGLGGADSGGWRGSRNPQCPPVTTATLRLLVPDHCQVYINGHLTKQQTLGGIHKNSRIYSLSDLDTAPFEPCTIEVIYHGDVYERQINVLVGQEYKIRFPDGFVLSQQRPEMLNNRGIPNGGPVYDHYSIPGVVVPGIPSYPPSTAAPGATIEAAPTAPYSEVIPLGTLPAAE